MPTPEIDNLIKEIRDFIKMISTAKGIVIVMVILILGIVVWKNSNFFTEITFTLKNDKPSMSQPSSSEKANNGNPVLEFGNIIIPPSPAKLPSIMVFEIKNSGNSIAEGIHISLDLGSAKVLDYEIIGVANNGSVPSDINMSVFNADLNKLRPHENIYLYLYTTTPIFKKISISSDNTLGVEDFTWSDHLLSSEDGFFSSSFKGFLQIIFGIFIFIMGAFFTIVLLSKLSKIFKFD